MRELTSHKVNGLNDAITIRVLDEPGVGNACHRYEIEVVGNVDADCDVQFQKGAIGEVGINGISNEALLVIVEDRLKGFQSGPFNCRENAIALTKIQEAMHWLHHRTRERLARGVEGTHAM